MLPNGKRWNAVGDGKYHARAKDSPIHNQAYIQIYSGGKSISCGNIFRLNEQGWRFCISVPTNQYRPKNKSNVYWSTRLRANGAAITVELGSNGRSLGVKKGVKCKATDVYDTSRHSLWGPLAVIRSRPSSCQPPLTRKPGRTFLRIWKSCYFRFASKLVTFKNSIISQYSTFHQPSKRQKRNYRI